VVVAGANRPHWIGLPASNTEIDDLRGIFEDTHADPDEQYRRLTNRRANKERVLAALPHCRVIHFATHGYYRRDAGAGASAASDGNASTSGVEGEPDGNLPGFDRRALAALFPGIASGIVLSGANAAQHLEHDDGILTAYEIASLDLRQADLVVLSACETAVGNYAPGEGPLSVQWAFHMAGAKSCVAGLWRVDDVATACLMQRFYENLWTKKLGRLDALREAQLWALRHPEELAAAARSRGADLPADAEAPLTSPRYWAAFTISGDWR
jgi:CHAT domain-containing protein